MAQKHPLFLVSFHCASSISLRTLHRINLKAGGRGGEALSTAIKIINLSLKEMLSPSSAIPLLEMCKFIYLFIYFFLQWEVERCCLLYWIIAFSPYSHHLLSTLFAPVLRAVIKDCLICYWSSLLSHTNLRYQLRPSNQPCAAVQ